MSQSEALARERYGVLAVTVWFEADNDDGFRARVSSIDEDGTMEVLGVTTVREQVVHLVTKWLTSVGET